MSKPRHTPRTLKYLRDLGFKAEVVERWVRIPDIPGGGKRMDLFGIIDIIAIKGIETVGIQSCGSNFREHDRKILVSEEAFDWLKGGTRKLLLIGWRKVKVKRGGVQKVWSPRLKWY